VSWALPLVLLAACGSSPAANASFWGPTPEPPRGLDKIRPGMSVAEARRLVPGLQPDTKSIRDELELDSHTKDVKLLVRVDNGTVSSMVAIAQGHNAREQLEQAWGKGEEAQYLDKQVLVWPDAETGWRATLRPALGLSHDLAFDNYLSAAQLFGDDPDKLAGLPEPVLGKTVDEVKHAYKDQIAVVTLNKELALTLPPTEWDQNTTRIELTVAAGKITKLKFEVPWKPHPDAHDTLLDLFKKKWGDPKEVDEENKGKLLVFRDEDPRVEIREDTSHGAWQVVMK
jgi:hypothetical protein